MNPGIHYVLSCSIPGFTTPRPTERPHRAFLFAAEVDDLDAAVADAVALGARVAAFQPQDNVRVLLDPAGHPFCLCRDD
jgi:Glyoxalase-like domain